MLFFHILKGPIMIGDDVAPHSIEPQFRKLGMPTSLVKGVPTLKNGEYVICKEGDKLKVDQAHLLKLFGKPMATVSLEGDLELDSAPLFECIQRS
jgi:mRNA turnover protein 4